MGIRCDGESGSDARTAEVTAWWERKTDFTAKSAVLSILKEKEVVGLSQYRRGYRIERIARKNLEDQGYYVIRSAGSKGLFDLIAINQREVKLIQIKKGRIDRGETERLKEFTNCPANARKEIWIWKRGRFEQIVL